MTQNPNSPQYTPDVPQWIAGSQQPPADPQPVAPAGQQAFVGQPAATAPLPGGQPAANNQGASAVVAGKGRWRSSDGKPTGLALAGAGSLLAVLAFLGGTAVGHAWGGSTGTDQTQFGGPGGGGRFRQLPGQTVPGQGGTGQGGTGQGQGQGQGTLPGQGNQQGQGTVPSTQPSTGTQNSGQQQLPDQSNGSTRTT